MRDRLTPRRALAAGALAIVLGAVAAVLVSTRTDDRPPRGTPPAARLTPVAPAPRPAPPAPAPVTVPEGPLVAHVVRRTQLRAQPGGHVVKTIDTVTGYGSQRVLAVVARRAGWLAVLTDHMPNSRAAWIPQTAVQLAHDAYRLDVDLSARRLLVRREGRVLRRVSVAIGKAGTPTPTGRFAVTDVLRIGQGRESYGCCALALTGRQPNLPQGWTTSDRLAIHGSPGDRGIGAAVSNGCLHGADGDMRWMLRHVPLGARVLIRA